MREKSGWGVGAIMMLWGKLAVWPCPRIVPPSRRAAVFTATDARNNHHNETVADVTRMIRQICSSVRN